MSNRKSRNKKRHAATFEKSNSREKIKKICKIEIGMFIAFAVLVLMYAVIEINKGLNYASNLKDFLNGAVNSIATGSLLGVISLLLFFLKENIIWEWKCIRAVLAIVCMALFAYWFLGTALIGYASHKEAQYKTEKTSGGDEEEPPEKPEPLKEFEWLENIYVLNLEEYLGDGADESEMGGLLLDYLENPVEVTEISKEEYEKHIGDAEGFHADFDSVSMTETKTFAVKNEMGAREKADENYSDSDNLKLKGDCLMNLGDIQPEDAVGLYEDALRNYIEALHIVYCYGEDRHPAIGKKDIWKAIGNTYGKLARRSDVQGVERERAEMLEGICAYILQNSL